MSVIGVGGPRDVSVQAGKRSIHFVAYSPFWGVYEDLTREMLSPDTARRKKSESNAEVTADFTKTKSRVDILWSKVPDCA